MNCPILPPLSLIQSGCLIDCAIEDVPNRTGTCTHAHKKQGLVRLLTGLKLDFWYWSVRLGPVSNSYWALPFFFFSFFLKCVFPANRGIVFIGCTLLFLITILIVVVYDYYLSLLLAEDWHFKICLSLDAVAERNKLLLWILFQKIFRFWSISPLLLLHLPHSPFPSPYSLSSVCSSLAWTLVLFCLFRCLVAGATLLDLDFIPGNLLEWASLFTCSDKLILHRISPVMMLKITNIV